MGYLLHVVVGMVMFCGIACSSLADFIPGTEDIPLMEGLTIVPETYTSFDNPDGRIISVVAAGEINASDIEKFYEDSLLGLGWTKNNNILYTRDHEQLQLMIAPLPSDIKKIQVTFQLSPRDVAAEA